MYSLSIHGMFNELAFETPTPVIPYSAIYSDYSAKEFVDLTIKECAEFIKRNPAMLRDAKKLILEESLRAPEVDLNAVSVMDTVDLRHFQGHISRVIIGSIEYNAVGREELRDAVIDSVAVPFELEATRGWVMHLSVSIRNLKELLAK